MMRYEMTTKIVVISGITAYRIRYLTDIPEHKVRKGDLGGYIRDEKVLPHNGTGVVLRNAVVIGGTVVGGMVLGGTIRGGTIRGGKVRSGTIYGGTIYDGEICDGEIYGGEIYGGEIHSSTIYDGVIKGGVIRSCTIGREKPLQGQKPIDTVTHCATILVDTVTKEQKMNKYQIEKTENGYMLISLFEDKYKATVVRLWEDGETIECAMPGDCPTDGTLKVARLSDIGIEAVANLYSRVYARRKFQELSGE
jgi:hypothetical protein